MGTHCTSCSSINKELKNSKKISPKCFRRLCPIGKGGFGKVWKVSHKITRTQYAMKEISKVKLFLKKSISLINEELFILKSLRNFFISNLHFAFQTDDSIFIVTDYFSGGDLRYHINSRKTKRFTQIEIKFILACIVLALMYLRKKEIIHRDIKPENLVFDSKGYLHLTDFGVSKCIKNCQKGITDQSGTIGYSSPETIMGLNHNFASDYFSLGIIAYELLMGKKPFRGKNKHQIKEQLLTKTIRLKPIDVPCDVDGCDKSAICNFINRLLQRKSKKRLGENSIDEIVYHPLFDGFNWNAVMSQQMESPFHIKPIEHVNMSTYSSDNNNIEEYAAILKRINNKNLFEECYFNYKESDIDVNERDCSNVELNKSVCSFSGYSCFTPNNFKCEVYKRNSGVSELSTKCE